MHTSWTVWCHATPHSPVVVMAPPPPAPVVPLVHVTSLLLARAEREARSLCPSSWPATLAWVCACLRHDSTGEVAGLLEVEVMWSRPSLDKSWGEAERSRRKGNSCYSQGRLEEALEAYTRALALAPPSGGQVALLLANRALVLLEQGIPGAALEQLLLAEQEGYPGVLEYKLLARRGVCLARLGRAGEAEVGRQGGRGDFSCRSVSGGLRKWWRGWKRMTGRQPGRWC